MDEVFILINYVKLIMQERINENQVQEEDIGIISPYKKQVFIQTISEVYPNILCFC